MNDTSHAVVGARCCCYYTVARCLVNWWTINVRDRLLGDKPVCFVQCLWHVTIRVYVNYRVPQKSSLQESFRGERVGTTFPLLKCLWMHYGRHCEPFSGHMHQIARFAYLYSLKFFRRSAPVSGPRHFSLARRRFHGSFYYETTTSIHCWVTNKSYVLKTVNGAIFLS